MLISRFRTRVRYVVGICAALATLTALLTTTASADPNKYSDTVLAGTGSDTTQDLHDAFNGFENGTFYTPLNTGSPNYTEIVSFDATGSQCITTKLNGPALDRPNGSSNGRRFLSRAFGGGNWGTPGVCNATARSTTGFADFARSSSGPSGAATDLTYLPFGRDGVTFAYYRAAGAPVTSLTRAQLTTLFTQGRTTIGGVSILPCGIQTGSGTYGFWNSVTTAPASGTNSEASATAECNALLGRAQENDGADLKARGDAAQAAVPGTQVVIGFSAGSFVSKVNGAAAGAPPAGVLLGSISNDGAGNNLGSPISGTAPNLVPAATFFNNGTFGRDVYNVVATSTVGSFLFTDLNAMLVGNTSAICSAANATTIAKFGFLPIGTRCGDTSQKGPYIA